MHPSKYRSNSWKQLTRQTPHFMIYFPPPLTLGDVVIQPENPLFITFTELLLLNP